MEQSLDELYIMWLRRPPHVQINVSKTISYPIAWHVADDSLRELSLSKRQPLLWVVIENIVRRTFISCHLQIAFPLKSSLRPL